MKTLSVGSNKKVLTEILSEPLCGSTTAKIDISTAIGNLTIDRLTGSEQLLASGTLEYMENQDVPMRSIDSRNGQAALTLKSTRIGRPSFRLPWAACIATTEWQIHLNPDVRADIAAHSGGGNLRLDLSALTVSRVSADTGGGNMEMILPDHAANLCVIAKTGGGNVNIGIGRGITGSNVVDAGSGAGNIEVRIPIGIPARIYATSGWGKEIVDSRFCQIDQHTYQSSDFDNAVDKVEITLKSGAGNVIASTM